MDISSILVRKFPGKEFILDGNSLDGLTWLDDSPAPTFEQLEALWPEVEAELATDLNAKASAIVKLRKLGLTDAEINSLVGIY